MNRISSQDRTVLVKLAANLPNGDETRRAILSALLRVGGYDKRVWMSVPAPIRKLILKHFEVDTGVPYYTGFPKPDFQEEKQIGEFTFGSVESEPAVRWNSSSGVGYFLSPAP